MHPLSTMLLVLALTPTLGHAAYSLDNVTASCSDALTISQSGGVSFQCMGNFTLTGEGDAARLFSDSAITLSASGDLIVERGSAISASGTDFNIGANQTVRFVQPSNPLLRTVSGSLSLGGGDVIVRQPGALVVAGASAAGIVTLDGGASHLTWNVSPSAGVVPEPATALLTLLGLSGLLLRRRA
ncbi:MAG: PEP-CTERM sorting domain-containing protein [Aquabacterium sp.]|nr:PEP-CTERM sorting domain-containing protein [Aquabacterium sp.]